MHEHQDFCGSRTEPCVKCSNYIMLKDQKKHEQSNCKYPAPAPVPDSRSNGDAGRSIAAAAGIRNRTVMPKTVPKKLNVAAGGVPRVAKKAPSNGVIPATRGQPGARPGLGSSEGQTGTRLRPGQSNSGASFQADSRPGGLMNPGGTNNNTRPKQNPSTQRSVVQRRNELTQPSRNQNIFVPDEPVASIYDEIGHYGEDELSEDFLLALHLNHDLNREEVRVNGQIGEPGPGMVNIHREIVHAHGDVADNVGMAADTGTNL